MSPDQHSGMEVKEAEVSQDHHDNPVISPPSLSPEAKIKDLISRIWEHIPQPQVREAAAALASFSTAEPSPVSAVGLCSRPGAQ